MRINLVSCVGICAILSCAGSKKVPLTPAEPKSSTVHAGQGPMSAPAPVPATITAQLASKGCTPGHFAAQVSYATGNYPDSVAVSDFNADGKADIVVANAGENTVSVLLNNGSGTFGANATYAAGISPYFVAVGDFNADGKADIAAANPQPDPSDSIKVLLNGGTGTFGTPATYATGANPAAIVVADFNADGKPDLVVTNRKNKTISVLLNGGAGTFRTQVTYPAGARPNSIAASDFNSDGKLDLAITTGDASTGDPSTVNVLLGRGSGVFAAPVSYEAGNVPNSIAVGDFNGDGKPDFATANIYTKTIGVFLNTGSGVFAAQASYPVGPYPYHVTVGDFDTDGLPDLAVVYGGSVNVLRNLGAGTFAAPVAYETGNIPVSVAVSDFNGDQLPDLVVANAKSNTVGVFLNQCK